MNTTKRLLNRALRQQIITPQQHQQLLQLQRTLCEADALPDPMPNDGPQFVLAHLLYYFGGFVAIGAMGLFMNLGFERYGGGAMMLICVAYAVFAGALARVCFLKHLNTPYSILLGFLLCLVPLFVFALQHFLGIWPVHEPFQNYYSRIAKHWLILEGATVGVGMVMLYAFRRSFLMLIVAVALWLASFDVVTLVQPEHLSWSVRSQISMYFGLLLVVVAIGVDWCQHLKRAPLGQDFAFWLYIVAVITFWGGLSSQYSDSEWAKLGYCLVNIVMLWLGILLRRRVFVVFGVMGVGVYLNHLAYDVFQDSMVFPLVVALIGFAIIFLGMWWHKHEARIYQRVMAFVPEPLRGILLTLHQ